MALSGKFLDEFEPRYQRNSKTQGSKNLRCFPRHSDNGHMGSGFCGNALTVELSGKNLMEKAKSFEIKAWGEFVLASKAEDMKVGDFTTLEEIKTKVRSRDKPDLPLIRGMVVQKAHANKSTDNSLQVDFNRQMLGWHYGWVSTKTTCDLHHVFRARIYYQARFPSSNLIYLGSVDSPAFQVYSRRRQKTITNRESKKRPATSPTEDTKKAKHSKLVSLQTLANAAISDGNRLRWLVTANKEFAKNRVLDRMVQCVFQYCSGFSPSWDGSISASSSTSDTCAPPGNSSQNLAQSLGFEYDFGFSNSLSTDDLYKLFPEPVTPPPPEQYGGMSLLRAGLKVIGKKTDEEIEEVIHGLQRISEQVMRLSKNNKGFQHMYKKWSSASGLKRLKQQISEEKKIAFEWTPEHDDETFDPENPAKNVENSIFAEYRQIFRDMVSNALELTNQTVEQYKEVMEIAAQQGCVFQDPYYPPPVRGAAFLHLQLHGNLNGFAAQDYGAKAKRFTSEEQQRIYARDLLVVKRSMFRRMLCSRLIQEQSNKRDITGKPEVPIPAEYDISGSWMSAETDDDHNNPKIKGLTEIMSHMMGSVPLGTFFSKLFNSMFSKLDITLTSETFVLQGEKVMLADPKLVTKFGTASTFRPATPLPLGPMNQEKKVNGWFCVDFTGQHVINLVIGGAVASKEDNKLFKLSLDPELGNTQTPKQRELSSYMKDNMVVGKDPEMRLTKQFQIPKDCKDRFILKQELFIFANGDDAPSMDSTQELSCLFSGAHRGFQGLSHSTKFVRNYIMGENEEFLDWL